MIYSQDNFDLTRVRALCIQITARMKDDALARRLQQHVVDEISLLERALGLARDDFAVTGNPRDDAAEAVRQLEKIAYG